jgi:arsenical pump membrane protein
MEIVLIFCAIFFSVAAGVRPFKIGKLSIDIATGPLLSLGILFALQVVPLEMITQGIFGNGGLKPWEIIVIFFTAAYVSISVDVTGILDFFAYKVIHRAHGNGVKLFFFFYLFACFLTVFSSNDIVILILTPIIFYLGKHAKINIVPLLFAEFFGANTTSMLLYIGNPTNIIVGNALGLGFLEFTQIMWIPTCVAMVANGLFLYLFFRKSLTRKFHSDSRSHFTVRNWTDALISSFLLLLMLVVLGFSRTLNVPIWGVTSFFAAVFIMEDLIFGFYYTLKHKALPATALVKSEQEVFLLYGIPEDRNEFWLAIKRMPWKIAPFTIVFFILVAGLNEYGAIQLLSELICKTSHTLGKSIFINGILGFLVANIINNQPMTIFFSSLLISESVKIPPAAFSGGLYAVVIASNLSANLTIVGSLAGLMWRNILKTKGLDINYFDFFKVGVSITPAVFLLTLVALYFVLV